MICATIVRRQIRKGSPWKAIFRKSLDSQHDAFRQVASLGSSLRVLLVPEPSEPLSASLEIVGCGTKKDSQVGSFRVN